MTSLVKDLTYPPAHAVKDPEFCLRLLRRAGVDPGAYIRVSNLILHVLEGSQLWVTKDVSDDLQVADLNPEEIKFEELEWPASRMEVFFEDPKIPTFLAVHTSDIEQTDAVDRAIGKAFSRLPMTEERYVALQAQDGEGDMLSVTFKVADIDKFAAGDTPDSVLPDSEVSTRLDGEEITQMRQLVILLFKVLLLASSEGHEIRRTREKPTKKQGGKPGFKNRPTTDRLIVEYLPRHHVERRQAAETEGKTHKFNGRRGHWRRFNSPFFVNKKGTKRFIFPIPGPDGTVPRKKFIVRKPILAQE